MLGENSPLLKDTRVQVWVSMSTLKQLIAYFRPLGPRRVSNFPCKRKILRDLGRKGKQQPTKARRLQNWDFLQNWEDQNLTLIFWSHPMMLRGHSWLCTREFLLVVFSGIPGIEPGSATFMANTLHVLLSLWPISDIFFFFCFLSHTRRCSGVIRGSALRN